jgi:hypothetical protein
MTNTIRFARFALIGASVLTLTSPVLARTAVKGDRMNCYRVDDANWHCSSPVSLRDRAWQQPMQAPKGDFIYVPQVEYPQSLPGGGY